MRAVGDSPNPKVFPVHVAQWAVILAAAGLLTVHSFPKFFGGPMTAFVDWATFALLASMAIAAILPNILSLNFKIGPKGLEAGLQAATVAAQEAAGTQLLPSGKSQALEIAATDPVAALELSRRSLADALKRLASSKKAPAGNGTLEGLATELLAGKAIGEKDFVAITGLAKVFDESRRAKVSAATALEVDYATQLMVGKLNSLVEPAPTLGV